MKLTLGQAAKEAGISKPSLSAAIKNGRVSAYKNESGTYEIDPAELFRVYPRKSEADSEPNSNVLPDTNPKTNSKNGVSDDVLGLLLAERDKLIEEKEKSIERLMDEKEQLRADLEDQKEHAKRITLLLEDHTNKKSGGDDWSRALKALEQRIANQEKAAKEREEREQKLLDENRRIRKAYSDKKKELETEKKKGFWQRLMG